MTVHVIPLRRLQDNWAAHSPYQMTQLRSIEPHSYYHMLVVRLNHLDIYKRVNESVNSIQSDCNQFTYVSIPPVLNPAQIIEDVMAPLYCLLQYLWLAIGIAAARSDSLDSSKFCVVPVRFYHKI